MPARKPKPGDKLEAPPTRVRGYYSTPYGRFMSVTTLLENGVAKPELQFWYAKEASQRAIDSIPQLARLRGALAREEMRKWVAKAAVEKKTAAGDLGSAVHNCIEARILGAPAPPPTDEQAPFLAAFDRFWNDHLPEVEATELVLANPDDGWAGTGDVWMTLPKLGPALVLGDWKSGTRPRNEAALQLSAYKRAKVAWLKDGTEVLPPLADEAVVVHIRPDAYPDSGYRIYPIDTSDAMYAAFLSIRDVAVNWTKGLAKTAIGEPYPLPDPALDTTTEVA